MIETIEELEALYGTPKAPSLVKVADHVTAEYGAFIKASPFVALATIDEIYFQCARAVMRADLWSGKPAPVLPTAGEILASMTDGDVGGSEYDKTWPARAQKTLW